MVDAVAAAAASPTFDVQYGPQGVQWCTPELLEAVAEASQRSGRRVHMHLLETRYQRGWADAAHPDGIVRHLDRIGLLSRRLTLAHCTWARPDELELIAERGATIAVNTSSNLGLRSGVAPLAEMVRRGCRVALGIDGLALDEDDDALREMRLAQLLHGGTGFRIDVDRSTMMEIAFVNGRRSVVNRDEGGALVAGQPADVLLLDWDAVDDDRLRSDLDPLDLVFARATARHIRELIVAGRSIVRDGRVTGVELAALRKELLLRLRSGMEQNAAFATSLGELEQAIRGHFESEAPCC
jgi:cytosine/adenosine deaminase-related metal-dependent hydrolase